ncbi:hypothetical protein KEM54_003108 [Ascosphaera aggregata]|nr:hypothetical protein KEM54_003108 [Ascosphaera aggregata]
MSSTTQHNTEANRPGNNWPSTLFPLGYKDGFCQWWANLPAATAEHRVLFFVPYLFDVPTQTQTGNLPDPNPAADNRTVRADIKDMSKNKNKDDSIPNADADADADDDAADSHSRKLPDSLVTADTSQPGQVTTAPSSKDPYGPRRWQSTMVELSGKNRALNEFSIERVGEPVENNLVILHGYGAGLGFFYKNFEPLSRAKGWQLYALDMLGMGRSTRPPFRLPSSSSKDREASITAAEDWFIDAIEEWREKRKIERFTLLGHSLGGYMAVAYALKYPGRLNKLILASPVGIPEDPHAVQAKMPTKDESFIPDQSNPLTQQDTQATPAERKEGQALRKPIPKWLAYLWDANISPFTFVRWTGPFGPRLVSGWTSRRFGHLPPEEASALHDYSYSLFRMKGSGEYALAYILAPGAFARKPLIRRISGVGRQMLSKNPNAPAVASMLGLGAAASAAAGALPSYVTTHELPYPVIFLYGSHDWMDRAGGIAAAEKINAERQRHISDPAVPDALKQLDRGWAKVETIQNAGHHLYLEGWKEFNDLIAKEMSEVAEAEKLRTAGALFSQEATEEAIDHSERAGMFN